MRLHPLFASALLAVLSARPALADPPAASHFSATPPTATVHPAPRASAPHVPAAAPKATAELHVPAAVHSPEASKIPAVIAIHPAAPAAEKPMTPAQARTLLEDALPKLKAARSELNEGVVTPARRAELEHLIASVHKAIATMPVSHETSLLTFKNEHVAREVTEKLKGIEDGKPTPGAHLFEAIGQRLPRAQLLRATALDTRAATGGFKSFATSKYGAPGASALATLQAIRPSFEDLIVDPGTVAHLAEFRAFLAEHPVLEQGDPWTARQAFSEALGTRTVYRALALTPEGYARLQKDPGLGSKLLQDPSRRAAETTRAAPLRTLIDDRVAGHGGYRDPLVSIAEKPRVAASVAGAIAKAWSERSKDTESYNVYLFTLKVPKLDIIAERPGSPVLDVDPQRVPKELKISWTDVAGRPHETTQSFPSPQVESFVLFGVDSSEITDVRQVPLERAGKFGFQGTPAPTAAP